MIELDHQRAEAKTLVNKMGLNTLRIFVLFNIELLQVCIIFWVIFHCFYSFWGILNLFLVFFCTWDELMQVHIYSRTTETSYSGFLSTWEQESCCYLFEKVTQIVTCNAFPPTLETSDMQWQKWLLVSSGLKGILHPKIYILLFFTYPHVVPNP